MPALRLDPALRMVKRSVRAAILLGAGLWCSAILSAPLVQWPLLYQFFSLVCHQIPGRSWHLDGEPFAVCIRCTSISLGFLAGLAVLSRPSPRRFKWALAMTAGQWLLAIVVVDSEVLRVTTAILLGGTAAPLVRAGIEEMFTGRIRTVHESM